MHDPANEFRRNPLLRTPVNKEKDRRSPHPPRRSFSIYFYLCKVVLVFVGKQPLIPLRRIVPSSPGLMV
jgi:hypothetical protein